MNKYTDIEVERFIEALLAWMVYAESNYSGDGMTALELTKSALKCIKRIKLK